MRIEAKIGIALLVAGVLQLTALVALFSIATMSGETSSGCDSGVAPVDAPTGPVGPIPGMDATQARNAAVIVAQAAKDGVPAAGAVIALMVTQVESGTRNLASMANPGSLIFPHDAVAPGDHDSVGIFQQRDAWGPMAERMDVAASAHLFYTGGHAGQRGLLDIPGWQQMAPGAVAQAVQVSQFPDRYAAWQHEAEQAVAVLAGSGVVPAVDPAATCTATVAAGTVVYPEDPATDRHNFGESGPNWQSYHSGTDFSVPCGTPVKASTGGTIHIEHGPSWYGSWLVEVVTGPHDLTTWYAHMQQVDVAEGDAVSAGDVLGQVGQEGNATGCHLHFEVHLHNGPIYVDDVDPSKWLAENVGKALPGGGPTTVPAVDPGSGQGERIMSLNVLGASHTAVHGGDKGPEWPVWNKRFPGVVDVVNRTGVSMVGFQEFQRPQYDAFHRAMPGWGLYSPSSKRTDNTIAWRTDTWTPLRETSLRVPYFNGDVPMPLVLFQHKSGVQVWVLDVHNPADTHGPAAGKRQEAVRREVALLSGLGAPALWLGDMNDREAFYCPATAGGFITAAPGGQHTPCRTPPHTGIDWIMGSPGVGFGGWTQIRLPGHVTDHPAVVTNIY